MELSGIGELGGPATSPATLVQVATPQGHSSYDLFHSRPTRANQIHPELALMLAAVLLSASEQVNSEKLKSFQCRTREELTIFQLAMAFRGDDTGLVGDVFEWSLLLALNSGEPELSQMIADAVWLSDSIRVDQPQAVLVAAEPGRLTAYSPSLPAKAALATGKRGRPPYLSNLLASVDSKTWKSDLVLGGGAERWVGASLKSNHLELQRSLRLASKTPHPPRIGITASVRPGITRDSATGAVLVHVPVDGNLLSLSKIVLHDVIEAFSRDLKVPDSALRQDATGIGRQLYRWRNRSIAHAAASLLEAAGGLPAFYRSEVGRTGASIDTANGGLIAIDTLSEGVSYYFSDRVERHGTRRRYASFVVLA